MRRRPHGLADSAPGAHRYGDSPYQPFSAYAGNPLIIDLDDLAAEGC
jgi:4-alpha-glucanotransferase